MVTSAPRLSVEDLGYGYHGHIVGHHVSFAVDAGEVLCVLGRNGEGKSTLFKTVLGLLPPLAGTVRVDGQPISGWNARRRALSFGYVPQSGVGGFPFTVREIVLMGRTAHRGPFSAPSSADRDAADAAIATLGIDHLAEREWLRVSGGERQLALVARALAQEPRILVLDEPTASLDFGNQLRVLDAVRRLAGKRALSVLLTTHHPEQAFSCADRVAVLAGGELLLLGSPTETITPRRCARATRSMPQCCRWPLPRLRAALLPRLTTAARLIRRPAASAPRRRARRGSLAATSADRAAVLRSRHGSH